MTRFATFLCGALILAGASIVAQAPITSIAHAQEAEVDTSTVVEMTLGDPNAPVKVVEYASYTCPHCARFHEDQFKKLKTDFIDTGKVFFTYREVYFDRFGLWASMIARCEPGKFFGLTDVIYENQSNWAQAGGPAEVVDSLRRLARAAGIDNSKLETCLQDGTKAQTLVAWYQENAKADGVQATPTLVINGETVSNMSYPDLKAQIEKELNG